MNISAEDKATKKVNKITITNDKGRLSKGDIDKLVQEAERFKADDDKVRERIEAKNSLESTTYHIKNTMNEQNLKDKFTAQEKQELENLVETTQKWLDSNQNENAETYKTKLKELESKWHPIIQRVYSQTAANPGTGAEANRPNTSQGNPTVDEVD